MSIEAAFASHLKADSAVAALVETRIYRVVAPADTPDDVGRYIVIQRISGQHVRHMTAATGLTAASLQVTCWADEPDGAFDVADAVREATDHFQGTMGTPPNTATIGAAFLEGEMDDYAPSREGQGRGVYAKRQTWTIWYSESIPTF